MMVSPRDAKQKALLTDAYSQYAKGLHALALFKIQSSALCTDLVQDTYIKTWAYLVKGGKIEVMKSFLYHTLNNLIIDEYRKKKPASLDVLQERGFDPKGDGVDRLIDVLDGKAALILIARLPEAYQKIMRMRYVQDLSLDEMSLITGSTKNALAVKIHRGLAKLKQFYSRTP